MKTEFFTAKSILPANACRILKKMKIAVILLCFSCLYLSVSASKLQNMEIKLSSNSLTFKTLFAEIEQQTSYLIVFSANELDINKKISFSKKKGKVREFLNEVANNTELHYDYDNNYIVFTKKRKNEKLNIVQKAQDRITGKVIDEFGNPIVGASVKEQNTKNGAITDKNGVFTLEASPNSTLVISFLGFLSQSISNNNRKELTIILKQDSHVIEDVVVGYAVQKKENLSGSVASVNTKILNDRPITNIGQALQGTVANLNIDPKSGDPNDLPSFNIRGFTSINGGSPLIVIDGVISDGTQLNHLNPIDIANVSVLKDAASSAIYGSRAAFGVILVKTKKGLSEKVSVNYNNNFNWRGLTVTPEYVSDPEIYFHDKNQGDTGNPNSGAWPSAMFDAIKAWKADPKNNPNYFYHTSYDEYFYFDFFNPAKTYVKNDAFSNNHNINISGKTDKVNYYTSGNYIGQDGLLNYGKNDYKQYNGRTKLDIQITPWWNVGSNTSLVSTIYKTNTYYMNKHDDSRNNAWSYGTVLEELLSAVPFGPYYLADNGLTYDWSTMVGQMEQGGNADKNDLTVNQLFTTKFDVIKDVFFINGQFNYSWQKVNTNLKKLSFLGTGGGDTNPWVNNDVSSAESRNGSVQHSNIDVYGTFHKLWNQRHDLTAIVGFNQESFRYNQQNVNRDHLISASIPSYNLAYGNTIATEGTTTWSLRGLYGRLGYIFDSKYIAEFNFRQDMTSRFHHDSRTVFSPSGSVAWLLSQERFFEPLKSTFNLFKLRASYGQLGNQEVDAYAYLTTMRAQQYGYAIGGAKPMYVSAPGLVSGSLTWEKVRTANLGIDLMMLNNRLSITADVYRRDTKDMLTTQGRDLPSVLGTSVPRENAADLRTVGWDLTVGWRDEFMLSEKPFNFNIDLTFADNRAEITKVANSTGSLNSYYVGQELGEIWGLNTMGIFATDQEAANWANQSEVLYQPGKFPSRAGTVKFEDRNGDGKISRGQWTTSDPGDYAKIGNTSPRYRYGITLGGQWNGFDVSAFFQGVMKRDYYPGWYDRLFWGMYSVSWYAEPLFNYTDRWTEENQDVNKYFPRLEQGNAHSPTKELGSPQTRYLQNGAYLRMKNLTLGYTIPANALKKLPVQRVRLFYSGENLFFISGLHEGYNVDPENFGFQYYPLQKSHSIGVNVTF